MFHGLMSRDREDGRATGQAQGVGSEAYLNGTPQGPTSEDDRIRGRSKPFMKYPGQRRGFPPLSWRLLREKGEPARKEQDVPPPSALGALRWRMKSGDRVGVGSRSRVSAPGYS
jgi:hypothetical protein